MLISIVVPVRDEEANVTPLAADISTALARHEWELIFVNDGSRDHTPDVLDRLAANDSRIRVVHLRRSFGQSAATQAGFDVSRGDVIVTMDGDRQNDPADIPLLIAKLEEGYDAVLGHRAARQDKVLVRKVPSLIANALIRRVLRVPFKDFGCALRAVRRDVVEQMSLYGEMHRFITALILQQGAKVVQVPVRHHPRREGQSKYNLSRTFRVVLDLITVKFLASWQTKPMHLFGGIGLGLISLGTLSLLASVVMKYTTGPGMTANPLFLLGVMMELLGTQFLSLGLIGEVMMRTYFESQGKAPYVVKSTRNLEPVRLRKAA